MNYVAYSIYGEGEYVRAGITFLPTPSLTVEDLDKLMDELLIVRERMMMRIDE